MKLELTNEDGSDCDSGEVVEWFQGESGIGSPERLGEKQPRGGLEYRWG